MILAQTHEYRHPAQSSVSQAAGQSKAKEGSIKVDMTSRFLGLVVVPGQHIVKIEVEELVSRSAASRQT